MKPVRIILAGLLLAAPITLAQDLPGAAADQSAICLDCHDFGPESPVHAVLAGSHGLSGDAEAMAGRRGCPDCHGVSAEHAAAPDKVSPAVSFGPRWTATAAAQDKKCLACHEANVARNWRHALHMFNNLTCVTCHDIHSWEDPVLVEDRQAQVCTICHKAQKQGVHGMQDSVADNPPCTGCHNPHDHESAKSEMLKNDSAGCRYCHDLSGAPAIYNASQKANNYHKLMLQSGRTCLDCHQGSAHAPADAVSAMVPEPVSSRTLTLFYPGQADSEWLLQNHPGSQPLRQGRNCQQCHRGEEAKMGAAQANGFVPASREIQVAFSRTADQLVVSLGWDGSPDDSSIALMWGDGGSDTFRRGGCFAACHSDLPGMHSAGLQQAPAGGDFAELWRLRLGSGQLEIATLLTDLHWEGTNLIQINENYKEGRWTVELVSPLNNTELMKPFSPEDKYTFGVALNGAGNPGSKHWVSLPVTLSFAGDETDFKVEQ